MNAITLGLLGLALVPIGPNDPDVSVIPTREFEIPLRVRRPESVKEVTLYVSSDEGKTWRKHASIDPNVPKSNSLRLFSFRAPTDGHYWFKVQVRKRSGELEPADLAAAPVGQKVLVRTSARPKEGDEEMEGLRDAVQRLEQRVEQLEARKKRADEMKKLRARLKHLERRVKELEGD